MVTARNETRGVQTRESDVGRAFLMRISHNPEGVTMTIFAVSPQRTLVVIDEEPLSSESGYGDAAVKVIRECLDDPAMKMAMNRHFCANLQAGNADICVRLLVCESLQSGFRSRRERSALILARVRATKTTQ